MSEKIPLWMIHLKERFDAGEDVYYDCVKQNHYITRTESFKNYGAQWEEFFAKVAESHSSKAEDLPSIDSLQANEVTHSNYWGNWYKNLQFVEPRSDHFSDDNYVTFNYYA
jgi:hypothetical protein